MKAAVMISDNRMKVIAEALEHCGLEVICGADETTLIFFFFFSMFVIIFFCSFSIFFSN